MPFWVFPAAAARHLPISSIHFEVYDMQIAEDLQLIVGHMLMQWLYENQSDR